MKLPVIQGIQGIVIYRGPSMFDGEPIVALATGFERVKNPKTGKAIQTWILRPDQTPLESLQEGNDASVCGSCKHRHFKSCYVNLARGPFQVWKAYKRGTYPLAKPKHLELFRDRIVRLGSYGDPAAVPISIWDSVIGVTRGHLGYTHAWRRFESIKRYCMASRDTESEVDLALSRGWKPFYVRREGAELPDGFFECPASKEQGKRLTCTDCMVCRGGDHREGQGVPSIVAHGPSWKRVYFERGIKAYKQKRAYANVVG